MSKTRVLGTLIIVTTVLGAELAAPAEAGAVHGTDFAMNFVTFVRFSNDRVAVGLACRLVRFATDKECNNHKDRHKEG